jgi:alginate O-acetyltransferase complex protein AlgJ
MQEPRARTAGDFVVIAVFIAILLLPAALALTGHMRADTEFIVQTEGRFPFYAPRISSGALATAGYERDLERQIADTFPLRTKLIEAYAYPRFLWLGETTSKYVVRAPDGWLFYRHDDERTYVTREWNPTDADLQRIAKIYADRARWCAQRGIHYVFYIAPNKTTIYPEKAPAWYRPQPPTPLDRLLPMLRADGVATVDLRPPLQEAARRGEVYSRGDTHWNGEGAYVAYRTIVPLLRTAGVRDMVAPTGTHVETAHGDLLSLSGVPSAPNDVVIVDYPHRAVDGGAPEYAAEVAKADFTTVHVMTVDNPRLPKAVMFGDSFSGPMLPFFAEDFRRTILLQQHLPNTPHFDRTIVEAEHPNVVIQELVERSLVFGSQFLP